MRAGERAISCEVCNTRLEEWEEPGEDGKLRPAHPYYPDVFVCPGCKAVGESYEAVAKSAGKNHSTHGVKVRLVTAEERKAKIQEDAMRRAAVKEEEGGLAGGNVPL